MQNKVRHLNRPFLIYMLGYDLNPRTLGCCTFNFMTVFENVPTSSLHTCQDKAHEPSLPLDVLGWLGLIGLNADELKYSISV